VVIVFNIALRRNVEGGLIMLGPVFETSDVALIGFGFSNLFFSL